VWKRTANGKRGLNPMVDAPGNFQIVSTWLLVLRSNRSVAWKQSFGYNQWQIIQSYDAKSKLLSELISFNSLEFEFMANSKISSFNNLPLTLVNGSVNVNIRTLVPANLFLSIKNLTFILFNNHSFAL